ncbi:hypothetical protein Tco_1457558 [Tanacetum coccineum]
MAQFKKKRDKNTTLLDFDGAWSLQCVEKALQLPLTSSQVKGGNVTIFGDTVTVADLKKPIEGRTTKLRNDILMFRKHHGESFSEAWTRFKDLLQKIPHHGIDLWLQIQIFYDHVSFLLKREIDHAAGGKLRDKNAKESWEIIEKLALYDHES